MANPVLVAKLALLLTDKRLWEKVIAVAVCVMLLSAAFLGSCGAMTFTDLGFSASEKFAPYLNEYNAVFESGAHIDDKLLYAVYAKLFAEDNRYKDEIDQLIKCFVRDDGLAPLTDSDAIFDKVERSYSIKISAYMRAQLLQLAAEMPSGYTDRSVLLRNLKASDGKTNIGLINFAMNAVSANSGYIYGAYGQDVTLSFLKKQQAIFIADSSANLTNTEIEFIFGTYSGKPSFDCIGLIKGYEWLNEDTGFIRYASNGFPDVGANGMERAATVKGTIDSLPEIPGLAVWMDGHIGVYIGDGAVIEAKGNRYGVVQSALSESAWTHWLQLPGITYVTAGTYPYGAKKVRIENGRIAEITAGVVSGKGDFAWPLPAPYGKDWITSGAGSRFNPYTQMWENSHGAVDIAAPAGTEIYAAADGVVTMSSWHDSYGNFVKIDHGNGWATLYAHQTRRAAAVGQSVTEGDIIGYVGSTGDSTGNHLHFEIRFQESRLDPMQFFE